MEKGCKLQHFALDENDKLVDIHDCPKREQQTFLCPCCRKELIAKRGGVRQWHFAHKVKACSYDKYLHSISEVLIMDWFNESESITIDMNSYRKCIRTGECKFYNENYCLATQRSRFDIKKYYSRCVREQRYNNFVADLFCQRNNGTDSPLFIEIFVTHECSEKKISSGIRIIEISIQSEEDVLEIVNSHYLIESERVRFYNFKCNKTLSDKLELPFQKYILFPSLKSYVETQLFTCKNYSVYRRGIYEISVPYNNSLSYFIESIGLYTIGKVKAYLDGILPKTCEVCKWQKTDLSLDKFCVLYKKCGNPKYCKDNEGAKCEMFRPDQQFIAYFISEFGKSLPHDNIDIWVKEPSVKQDGTK